MTNYSKIYAQALRKMTDFDIPNKTLSEVEDDLFDLLEIAISRFHVCTVDLTDRNDEQGHFNSDLTDKEIDILSNYMVMIHIDSKYLIVPTLLSVGYSSSDVNAFSNANHLDKMTQLHDRLRRDTETLVARYDYQSKKRAVELLGKPST